MAEFIVITTIVILFILFLKWRGKTGMPPGEKENVSVRHKSEGIVGKSTFVLTTERKSVPESGSSGKMDIEVPLEYEMDIETIEELEELEQLGLPTEISFDITFEDMMEVVNEVESVKPQNPTKAGKLLHENENTDWVEQIASSVSDYQKRIVELIDLHLRNSVKDESTTMPDDRLNGFDIQKYIK